MKFNSLVVFLCLLAPAVSLTGCYDQPPMPRVVGHDASGNAIVQEQQDAGLSAAETALAAGAGAAVGSVIGNAISTPRSNGGSYVRQSPTIIQKKVVIVNKQTIVKRQVSRSRSWSSGRSFRRR